jgi:hypothetical protein
MEHYFYENNNIYRLDEEKFEYGIYHILYRIGSISENKFIFSMYADVVNFSLYDIKPEQYNYITYTGMEKNILESIDKIILNSI